MAKNRKNQAAEIRFGPVLKVVLLCLLIGGSAIGYVWQQKPPGFRPLPRPLPPGGNNPKTCD